LLGTPVAAEVLIGPGVQFKAVEGNALYTHPLLTQMRPHFAIEAVFVHPKVSRRISQADNAGKGQGRISRLASWCDRRTHKRRRIKTIAINRGVFLSEA
jgi:hypothetical protein